MNPAPLLVMVAAVGAFAMATQARASLPPATNDSDTGNQVNAITNDVYVLAQTAWGEARNQGTRGMQAVMNVIINRRNDPRGRWGRSVAGICKQPAQFTCWSTADRNYLPMVSVTIADPIFRQALQLASLAVAGALDDLTGGANHYYNPRISNPSWAASMYQVAVIGDHRFMVG